VGEVIDRDVTSGSYSDRLTTIISPHMDIYLFLFFFACALFNNVLYAVVSHVSAPSLLVHPHFFNIRFIVQHNGERQ